MKTQTYNNHIRFYPPHHFIYYPIIWLFNHLVYILLLPQRMWLYGHFSVQFCSSFCLAFMLRQHALTLQNRIVRLWTKISISRHHWWKIWGIWGDFNDAQIFALRRQILNCKNLLLQTSNNWNPSGDEIKNSKLVLINESVKYVLK
jgi:hypothetical protein